jgi:hypothetical protein
LFKEQTKRWSYRVKKLEASEPPVNFAISNATTKTTFTTSTSATSTSFGYATGRWAEAKNGLVAVALQD